MTGADRLRVCIVYDCLFPYTVGGAERWYRRLSERLVEEGHAVAYLTLRQWDGSIPPDGPDTVAVTPAGPRLALYTDDGRRRILPPLVFGACVFLHLLRHGRSYDVVHTASFPFFSVLAAAVLRPAHRYRLVIDWHEFWSRRYWRSYLGPLGGRVGWTVQQLCLKTPHTAYCFARLTAERLRSAGLRGSATVLEGEYAGPSTPRSTTRSTERMIVAAARHIPEKRLSAIPAAVAEVRRTLPELRARILGDGPERPRLVEAIRAAGLEGVIDTPGFVATPEAEEAIGSALCLLHPSEREGYGLVVVEAAASGTPVIVVAGEDNAATELVEDGVNGFISPSRSPDDLAKAVLKVHAGGEALRASTRAWFERNVRRLSLDNSLEQVVAGYRR